MTDETTRVVVGVDFEETGDSALLTALRLTRQLSGSELHCVHVLPHRPGKEKLDTLTAAIDKAGQVLSERARFVAHRIAGDTEWDQHSVLHVRVGDAADVLHQLAVDVDADLIVVGHHERRGVKRLMLGSVAEALLREAHLPVLVARPKDFEGLKTTTEPEPAREGEELHAERSWNQTELIRFGPRTSHVSGLI